MVKSNDPHWQLIRDSDVIVHNKKPGRRRPWRRLHFWISVVYTVTNIPHLIADILVPDSRGDQVLLMVVLLVIGLLINAEGWRWWRSNNQS